MSNKRPLSPESSNGYINKDVRSMKRLKLHSIIQELRNEEANLVILKKLRFSQQIASRTNHHSAPTSAVTTNGFHSTAKRAPAVKPTTPLPSSNILSKSSVPSPIPAATRKPTVQTNPPLNNKVTPVVPNKTSTLPGTHSLEERKTQAKKALRQQLERDLLNIPPPKPLLQDIQFVPNPNSLEFQPYIGLEDVVQCLYELQADRHRLPQRFTDRAQIDEPNVCDHCGTDFTIRWWKHISTGNSMTHILCDRCKKQVTRRTLKSDHSALLKSVFVSAMEQEKEIEKSFHALIKQQQKNASRPTSSTSTPASKPVTPYRPVTSSPAPSSISSTIGVPPFLPSTNHQLLQKPKPKTSLPQPQNFATKLSQQSTLPSNATRKSNPIPQTQINSTNHTRIPSQSTKTPMSVHHHSPHHQQHQNHHHHHQHQHHHNPSTTNQQQFRSAANLSQQVSHQSKNLSINKVSKNATVRQQNIVPTARPNYLPGNSPIIPPGILHPPLPTGNTIRPTATKRRTLPAVNMK